MREQKYRDRVQNTVVRERIGVLHVVAVSLVAAHRNEPDHALVRGEEDGRGARLVVVDLLRTGPVRDLQSETRIKRQTEEKNVTLSSKCQVVKGWKSRIHHREISQ